MNLPQPDPLIPLITLPNWVKAAAACGFSLAPMLDALGITADLMQVETATARSSDMERLMAVCVKRSRQRYFPLVLGETFAFEYLPELETFLTTSPTLRESARIFDWLRVLLNPHLVMRLIDHGDLASLRLDPADGRVTTSFQWFVEATFASVLKFGRTLLGGRGDFVRAAFQHARPDHADEIARTLRVTLAYGQAHNELQIPSYLLDLPLQGAFDSLHQQAEQRVAQRLSSRHQGQALSSRLMQLLQAQPRLLGGGMEAAAHALGLHPRTMQRRLAEERLSFARVVDEVRLHLAEVWLADPGQDLESISARLGFSDRRSFTRAFQRWSGQTPSAFRSR